MYTGGLLFSWTQCILQSIAIVVEAYLLHRGLPWSKGVIASARCLRGDSKQSRLLHVAVRC